MQIQVAQVHIDNGIREDVEQCPIALAICDHFPHSLPSIEVGNDYVQINDTVYYLDDYVKEFIRNFDMPDNVYLGDEFEPFTFELGLEQEF